MLRGKSLFLLTYHLLKRALTRKSDSLSSNKYKGLIIPREKTSRSKTNSTHRMRQRGRALTTVLAVPDLDEFLWLFVRVTFVTGNGYYIPKATEQGLNVKVSLQTSRNHRGKKDTSARYATAWLDHGANPTAKGYEYAILVGTQLSKLQVLKTFNVKFILEIRKSQSSLKNHNVIFWSIHWKIKYCWLAFLLL